MTNRLYHYSLNEHNFDGAKAKQSDIHNVLRQDNKNDYVSALTEKNVLVVNGKRLNPVTDRDEALETVRTTIEKIKGDFSKDANSNAEGEFLSNAEKSKLQLARTKFKAKVSKWIDNSKTEEEKNIWQDLKSKIGNEEINSDEFISQLSDLGKSVKRFNDKKKAILNSSDFNKLLGTSSRNIGLSIITKELVYKIPDKYEKNIDPEDWNKIGSAMQKRFFPDFDIIYKTVHADEKEDNAHIHMRLSGRNNQTGKFDIQDQLINRMAKLNKDFPFKDRKYSSLTQEELVEFGELYQDEVFKSFNNYVEKLNYDFVVVKRTAEEQKNDSEIFLDSKRAIANREYNCQNKMKEENKKLDARIEVKNIQLENIENDIEHKQVKEKKLDNSISDKIELSEELDFEIEEKETLLNKINTAIKNTFNSAVQYAKENLPSFLQQYKEEQKQLDDLNIEVGDAIHNSSIEEQPTEQQRQDIKNSRPKIKWLWSYQRLR